MIACLSCVRLTGEQLNNVSSGMVVNKAVIKLRIEQELPFMATENVIMAMVDRGYSRQETHEEIRVLSHQAGAVVKQDGKPNDLIDRIKNRGFFEPILPELAALIDPGTFTGRSAQNVEKLINTKVKVALEKYREALEQIVDAELKV